MISSLRIEQALNLAVASGEGCNTPPRLAAAIRYTVFPGGARIRPRLCLSVAQACGDGHPALADAAAAAIELMHCASLVHDDLPCFDDAQLRRGKPAVHRAFGEPLAVLVGDALIVRAFETLAGVVGPSPRRVVNLIRIVGASVGSAAGIIAGQAWECETQAVLADYQRAKTGSLFAAATMAGAEAAGFPRPGDWQRLGERIGEAYQVADDVLDVAGTAEQIGKPTGQDAQLGRPNVVSQRGMAAALCHLDQLIAEAVDSIPACAGAAELRDVLLGVTHGLLPSELRQAA